MANKKQSAYQVVLDIREFVQNIQVATTAFQGFQDKMTKGFKINVNDAAVKGIAEAIKKPFIEFNTILNKTLAEASTKQAKSLDHLAASIRQLAQKGSADFQLMSQTAVKASETAAAATGAAMAKASQKGKRAVQEVKEELKALEHQIRITQTKAGDTRVSVRAPGQPGQRVGVWPEQVRPGEVGRMVLGKTDAASGLMAIKGMGMSAEHIRTYGAAMLASALTEAHRQGAKGITSSPLGPEVESVFRGLGGELKDGMLVLERAVKSMAADVTKAMDQAGAQIKQEGEELARDFKSWRTIQAESMRTRAIPVMTGGVRDKREAMWASTFESFRADYAKLGTPARGALTHQMQGLGLGPGMYDEEKMPNYASFLSFFERETGKDGQKEQFVDLDQNKVTQLRKLISAIGKIQKYADPDRFIPKGANVDQIYDMATALEQRVLRERASIKGQSTAQSAEATIARRQRLAREQAQIAADTVNPYRLRQGMASYAPERFLEDDATLPSLQDGKAQQRFRRPLFKQDLVQATEGTREAKRIVAQLEASERIEDQAFKIITRLNARRRQVNLPELQSADIIGTMGKSGKVKILGKVLAQFKEETLAVEGAAREARKAEKAYDAATKAVEAYNLSVRKYNRETGAGIHEMPAVRRPQPGERFDTVGMARRRNDMSELQHADMLERRAASEKTQMESRIERAQAKADKLNATLRSVGSSEVFKKEAFLKSDDVGRLRLNSAAAREATTAVTAYKKQYDELGATAARHLGTHQSIGKELAGQVVRIAKWVVMYRAVHQTILGVEQAVRHVLMSGMEWLKQVELQKIGLVGILAENYDIIDAQGRQLHGVAALNQLQGESTKQWKQLQASALAVVGTTEDLMLLYNSILPHAAKLQKGTADVQEMVKSTAIAASLMNISFQDARSAIISLLQGRSLQRNKLVSVLGFSEGEIAGLKGTPKLFDEVLKRLGAFKDLGDVAADSYGALLETLRDVTGLVGSAFASPIVDLFKQFMRGGGYTPGMGKEQGGIMGMLFEQGRETLEIKERVKATFAEISAAISEALDPIRELGRRVSEAGTSGLMQFINGARDVAKTLMTMVQYVTIATMGVIKFIAANRELLKAFVWVALISTAARWLGVLHVAINNTIKGMSALIQQSQLQARGFAGFNAATGQVTFATKAASAQVGILGRSMIALGPILASVGVSLVTGGILTVLGWLAAKIARVRQEANDATAAMQKLGGGNVWGALSDARGNMASSNPETAANAYRVFGGGLDTLDTNMSNLHKDYSGRVAKVMQTLKPELEAIKSVYSQLATLQATISEELKKPVANTDVAREQRRSLVQESVEIAKAQNAIRRNLETQQQWAEAGKDELPAAQDRFTKDALESPSKRGPRGIGGQALANKEFNAASARYNAISSDLEKVRSRALAAGVALKELDTIDQTETRLRAPKEPPGPKEDLSPKTQTPFDEMRRAAEEWYDWLIEAERLKESNQLQTAQETADSVIAIEEAKFAAIQELLVKEYTTRREVAQKAYNHENAQKAKDRSPEKLRATQGVLDELDIDYWASQEALNQDLFKFYQRTGIEGQGRDKALSELSKETALQVKGEIAAVLGEVEESAIAKIDKIITAIRERFEKTGDKSKGDAFVAELEGVKAYAVGFAEAEAAIKSARRELESLRDEQEQLDRRRELGQISSSDFVRASITNRDAQRSVLTRELAAHERKAGLLAGAQDAGLNVGEQKMDDARTGIRSVRAEIQTLNNSLTTAHQTALAFLDVLGNLAGIVGMFSEFNDGIAAFSDGMSKTLSMTMQFDQTMQSISEFSDKFKSMGGGLAALFGKGKLNQSAGPPVEAAGAAGGALSSGGGVAAAIPMIGMAVSAAISIATALFAKSVKKAKEAMTDTIDDVSKAVAKGALTIGDAQSKLEAERAAAVKKYSQSKSGRKALKEMLPQFDAEIDKIKDQIKSIREAFEESLKGLSVGSGPFADFAKQLFDLEKQTREYLNTFQQNTLEYADALAKVTRLYNITLQNARTALRENALGFESEALGSIETVYGLLEEQAGIYESMEQLTRSRLQLEEQAGDLQREMERSKEDVAKEVLEIQEEYQAKLEAEYEAKERILELQKKIADILKKQAEDEAAILRRGVLEAQLTMAEQKASDIAKVRTDAAEALRDTRKELATAEKDKTKIEDGAPGGKGKEIAERERDLYLRKEDMERDWQRQLRDLNYSREDLALQEKKLAKQLRLNAIRTEGAKRVAAMEAAIFGIQGDEYEIAEMRAQMEVKMAELRIVKWRETAALIAAITESAQGSMEFDPPTGFPQIRVVIGNIIIDATQTTTPVIAPPTPERPERPERPGPPGKGPSVMSYDGDRRRGYNVPA